ncbi:hypothetical protein HRI_004355600 [Hibiscus trionum]|uniref:Endonuclease/exonuclease/phosphatase domain-containing protein n=1 Tax=Hibiscus trionum TaxID=183268 RepID=A0A9W7MLT6_HIBTR|nr:hypothetical protein HRI_004355600 [Hibiscus trionum]
MSILIWNVRGLNDPLKQKKIVNWLENLMFKLYVFLETRVKENNVDGIVHEGFAGWKFLHNYVAALNGRIWILYRGDWFVVVLSLSNLVLKCSLKNGDDVFFFSFVYGCNGRKERKCLWEDLD